MKHTLWVLCLGLLGGIASHYGWLALEQPHSRKDGMEAQLAWIRKDLKLTPDQYARIKAIHEQSSPHLVALATRVAHMRDEFAAFERQRTTTGEIDFIEFARFVEERRRIDRECLSSTRQLVDASAGVMTPSQRQRYLSLLPADHLSALTRSSN